MRRHLVIGVAAAFVVAILGGSWYAHYKLHKFHGFVRLVDRLAHRIDGLEATRTRLEQKLDAVSASLTETQAAVLAQARAAELTQKQAAELAQARAAALAQKPAAEPAQAEAAELAQKRAVELERDFAARLTADIAQRKVLTAGPADSALELFGRVSPFDRNGLLETYGGSLREPRQGPISLAETVMTVTHDQAWVIWSPDFSPAADATMLAVDMLEAPHAGTIEIGLVMSDGRTFAFDRQFGPARPTPPNLLPPLVPDEFVEAAKGATSRIGLERVGRSLRAALPDPVLAAIAANPDSAIRHWYVRIDGAAGSSLRFRRIALVQASDEEPGKTISVSGKVRGGTVEPGSVVRLVDERGARREQTIGADGSFRFDDLAREAPISLSVSHTEMDFFSSLGRWFVPGVTRDDLAIDLRPTYVNTDGHHPDPKKAKFITPRAPLDTGAVYETHARQVWPGHEESIQQYDSTTFTNNMGYIDRDRFFDNPGHCMRIVHIGSSHAVALQVRPFEKYNILMEEELGVALGRCVEVISAGRDNGDIGANYGSIRDYAVRFDPDAIVIESGSTLIFQLHPQLLKAGFGWDYEHSGSGNFVRDDWGDLDWRPPATDYPLYTTPPTFPELVKGLPFFSSLSVPASSFPRQGEEAFDRLAEITHWLMKTYPAERFVLQSGLDQAQCQANCLSKVTLGSETVDIGASVFRANFEAFCADNHFQCINPPVPDEYKTPETSLTFTSDGHYSVRGHQWLAGQLTAGLLKMLPASPSHLAVKR